MFDGVGSWMIFRMIGMILMLLMMMGMFGIWRRGRPGVGPLGPMGGGHDGCDRGRDEFALDLLRRRHVAGEINDEQFDAMRRTLEDRSP